MCAKPKASVKHHNPRFTAVFTSRIQNLDEAFVSDADEALGWDIISDPRPGNLHGKAWIRRWTAEGVVHGVAHKKGDLMLTWQVRRGQESGARDASLLSPSSVGWE